MISTCLKNWRKKVLKFESKLVKATIKRRYKRFLADVILEDGVETTVHCPNTGSMKSCWQPGDTVYLADSSNPKRKYRYTWELSKTQQGFIGINTSRPNKIVYEAIKDKRIKRLEGYTLMRREVKYGKNSRIDILMQGGLNKPDCYIEIKNVTLWDKDSDTVQFPDAVTERGQKHLAELMEVVKSGQRAVLFYLINRPEGRVFQSASIDQKYADLLNQAVNVGVEVIAYRVKASLNEIVIDERVPVKINSF